MSRCLWANLLLLICNAHCALCFGAKYSKPCHMLVVGFGPCDMICTLSSSNKGWCTPLGIVCIYTAYMLCAYIYAPCCAGPANSRICNKIIFETLRVSSPSLNVRMSMISSLNYPSHHWIIHKCTVLELLLTSLITYRHHATPYPMDLLTQKFNFWANRAAML